MASAIQYVRNHFAELTRYLDDPHLPMNNNEAEQLTKQIAIGRKNWLCAGSTEDGERTAALLSLVSSAMRNDLDVWAYAKDVLDQISLSALPQITFREFLSPGGESEFGRERAN